MTAELAAEGTARDAIRAIQQARRDADLDISDRISTTIGVAAGQVAALEANEGLIRSETLTVDLRVEAVEGSGNDFTITVAKQEQQHG